MSTQSEACEEAWKRLDTMEREVTPWEAGYLEGVKHWGLDRLSGNQCETLAQMVEHYLEDYHLAAEVRGQERLL